MPRSTIAISLDETTLERLDMRVERAVFRSRSQAIRKSVEEKLAGCQQYGWNCAYGANSRIPSGCSQSLPSTARGITSVRFVRVC